MKNGSGAQAAAAAAKWRCRAIPSSGKYGGAMTDTPSAPASAAWAARVTVSAVVWAPQWAKTVSRPLEASTNRCRVVWRSGTERAMPSPALPQVRTPSMPAPTRKSTSGATASSPTREPPSRSGVTAAANAPRSSGVVVGQGDHGVLTVGVGGALGLGCPDAVVVLALEPHAAGGEARLHLYQLRRNLGADRL